MVVGINLDKCLEYIVSCRNPDGAYRNERAGNPPADSELRATRWAITTLKLQDHLGQVDPRPTAGWLVRCLNRDGSASGSPRGGEPTIAATVDCLSSLYTYGYVGMIDKDKTSEFLVNRKRTNGGFGEEDAGDLVSTYRTLASLFITDKINSIDREAVANSILGYQNESGGFKGDYGNASEISYSFYGLASLFLLQKLDLQRDFRKKTEGFIVKCQNRGDGGFGSSPDQPSMVYNSMYALANLRLLDSLKKADVKKVTEFMIKCQTDTGGFCMRPGNYNDNVMSTGMVHMALHLIDTETPLTEAALLTVGENSITSNKKYGLEGDESASDNNIIEILKGIKE